MNYEVELSRNNVTVSQFLSAVRAACKAKGIDCYIDRQDFESPSMPGNSYYLFPTGSNNSHNYNNGELTTFSYTKEEAPALAETCRTLPYDSQTYILNHDGSMYNEIIEFTFDDNRHGHGYYYQANRGAE